MENNEDKASDEGQGAKRGLAFVSLITAQRS